MKSIVDLTPINLGRDVHSIRRVSEASGVNVVVATGFYWTEEPQMHTWDVKKLAGYMVRDIREGILGTGIKAGIIKCATDHPGVDAFNKKLLQAAATAHRETGVPISTHTTVANTSARDQVAVFREFGVDLGRVVIGHLGDSTDLDYLQEILDSGCFIGMDRFGLEAMLPTDDRVQTVAKLCAKGYAGQMVISTTRAASRISSRAATSRNSPQLVLRARAAGRAAGTGSGRRQRPGRNYHDGGKPEADLLPHRRLLTCRSRRRLPPAQPRWRISPSCMQLATSTPSRR